MIITYECNDCGRKFEEPDDRTVCLEYENGVGSLFGDLHYTTAMCCPWCRSTDLDELHDWSDEEGENEEDE